MAHADVDDSDVEAEVVARCFPVTPNLAFAYGSGVFAQVEADEKKKKEHEDKPMVDFILAVDDPLTWHKENLRVNANHYSFLRHAGPRAVTFIQEQFGARIYFNTLVDLPDMGITIKYGVISTAALLEDLNEWTTLYVSGRLHKPVRLLMEPSGEYSAALSQALRMNLHHALRVSALLLPERFDEMQLFSTIAGLSYTGDVRMGLAENPRKVENIVRGSFGGFEALYAKPLAETKLFDRVNGSFVQDNSPAARAALRRSLPLSLQVTRDMSAGIRSIVTRTSRSQTIKGLVTAGLLKSAVYGLRKVRKAFR